MQFEALISKIEQAKGEALPEHELLLMRTLWDACVDCVADEYPVLGDGIRRLKQGGASATNR